MSEEVISVLERELISRAGPLGKFVLKKQILDMGQKPESFPEDKLPMLIDAVVQKAIFDENQRKAAIRELNARVKGA